MKLNYVLFSLLITTSFAARGVWGADELLNQMIEKQQKENRTKEAMRRHMNVFQAMGNKHSVDTLMNANDSMSEKIQFLEASLEVSNRESEVISTKLKPERVSMQIDLGIFLCYAMIKVADQNSNMYYYINNLCEHEKAIEDYDEPCCWCISFDPEVSSSHFVQVYQQQVKDRLDFFKKKAYSEPKSTTLLQNQSEVCSSYKIEESNLLKKPLLFNISNEIDRN